MRSETENRILEIARSEFVKNGFSGTRMQAIADKAEINKAMLHYYFRSKEKLYREIFQDILNTMVPRFLVA
ncbi:MAG: helix-turn-helix domain-containing protein, partial [Bacteroidota bacterium]